MEALDRYINFNDWLTLICVLALFLLTFAKKISPYHFKNFLLLILSDKYIKTHKEDTSKKRVHYTLLAFQGLILPLVIYTFLLKLTYIESTNWFEYIKIFVFYVAFYGIKFLLEIGTSYLIKENIQISSYIFQKQTYFNYVACCLFPIILFVIYSLTINPLIIYIIIILLLFLLLASVILVITNHRTLFYSKPYYFILYLCAFEIAPYVLTIYYYN